MDWHGRQGRPDTGIDLVATDAVTGEAVAIQCKFYDPKHTVSKPDIDSFLSASGKAPFRQRVIVTTSNRWGPNAEHALADQQIPVQRVGLTDLAESSVDWDRFDLTTPEVMELRTGKVLRLHQKEAVAAVLEGFTNTDRGKMIMACGTGKTFTSLRIAEQVAAPGGSVLFLVPSIALLSQSLREWGAEAATPMRAFAVCSDPKVSRATSREQLEDATVVDLPLPATTDPARLHAGLTRPAGSGHASADADAAEPMTVVFSTYQSIEVVAEAQRLGAPAFDMVICDEAHRTTGVTAAGAESSAFVKVHDQTFVDARRRLYMTATPRLYDDSTKTKGREAQAVLASMDDEAVFGPEFHRLGFGEAVSRGLLTDYKVLVLAVDERSVARTFQAQMADADNELRLDDLAKIVGCWNGLAKRGRAEAGFGADTRPMKRAVAFARTIADSKTFAEKFRGVIASHVVVSTEDTIADEILRCEVDHVDGTYNILTRNERLDWLKADTEPGVCRVLSNARCLSEGVDVPALDAVMFLNPQIPGRRRPVSRTGDAPCPRQAIRLHHPAHWYPR